jgi:hypothetical protein
LAHLNNGECSPRLDQVLASLFQVFAADRIFPLATGQGRHCFGPADSADSNGLGSGTYLPHLIRLIFVNEQLHQGTGVTEEDHQLNPDPQSRSH